MTRITDPQRDTLGALRDGGHASAETAGWPPHATANVLNRLYCMGLADRLGAPGSRSWWITAAGVQAWNEASGPPDGGLADWRPRTPEDGQTVTTPEAGQAMMTRG